MAIRENIFTWAFAGQVMAERMRAGIHVVQGPLLTILLRYKASAN